MNGIIIPMLLVKSLIKSYIFQLTKCEQKGVSKIIDFEDRNFSSMKPQQVFPFFLNQNILFLGCSKNNKTYISDILTLFEYICKGSKLKTCENEHKLS